MDFEAKLQRLSEVTSALENDKLPLIEALDLYKEGMTLAIECKKDLENAKLAVKILNGELNHD